MKILTDIVKDFKTMMVLVALLVSTFAGCKTCDMDEHNQLFKIVCNGFDRQVLIDIDDTALRNCDHLSFEKISYNKFKRNSKIMSKKSHKGSAEMWKVGKDGCPQIGFTRDLIVIDEITYAVVKNNNNGLLLAQCYQIGCQNRFFEISKNGNYYILKCSWCAPQTPIHIKGSKARLL